MDSEVVVHRLPTRVVCTFNQNTDQVFLPHLENKLKTTARIDVVWDDYRADSLKESNGKNEGQGYAERMDFLYDPKNKTELFAFFTHTIEHFKWLATECVHVTSWSDVMSLGDIIPMGHCNHEKEDTGIVIHVTHALQY